MTPSSSSRDPDATEPDATGPDATGQPPRATAGPERVHGARAGLRAGLAAPLVAVRRTARDPVVLRVQLAWAAVVTASWAVTVALTVTAYDAGGSATVSVAVVARTAPGVLVGPGVGRVVDRIGGRRSLRWSAVVCALASGAAAAITAGTAGSAGTAGGTDGALVAVVVLLTVVTLTTMVFRAAQSVVVPELVEEAADLTAANVLSSAIESLGVFVGPALAGVLLALHGAGLALAAAGTLFAAAAVLLAGLGRTTGGGVVVESGGAPRLGQLYRVSAARLVLALVLVQTVVSGALVVLYAALAVEGLGTDLDAVGMLTAAFGLGGVVGSLGLFALAGSSRLGILTAAALATWGLPLLLFPVVPGVGPVLVLLVVVGVGNVLFDVTTVTLLQRAVPTPLLGQAFGALETAVVVGLTAGAVLAPALDRVTDPAVVLGGLGAALVVAAGAALTPLRRLDRSLAAPALQVSLLRGLAPFTVLPTVALERLALRLRPLVLRDGEVAVRQGERGDAYYVVEDGLLRVTVDGREVAELGVGEGFGEVALLRDGVRTATLTAAGPVRLQELAGPDFLAAVAGGSGVGLAAADRVAQERLRRAAPRDRSSRPS